MAAGRRRRASFPPVLPPTKTASKPLSVWERSTPTLKTEKVIAVCTAIGVKGPSR